MALYEYRCRTCDTRFEVSKPMSESSSPSPCPDGHADTVKLLSSFASVGAPVSVGAGAPARPMMGGGGCGGGCACAH